MKKRRKLILKAVVAAAFLVLVFVLALSIGTNKSQKTPAQPKNEKPLFTFATAGDLGSSPNTKLVLKQIKNSRADFALALGDLSYSTTPTEQGWCDFVASIVGKNYPFMLVTGNHDTDEPLRPGEYKDDIGKYEACLPNRMQNLVGKYSQQYYFDYKGVARFIQIAPDMEVDGHHYRYTSGDADYKWLTKTINDARGDNIPWVIVSMHKNCVSAGIKACEIGEDLFNLLVKSNVSLILQGHDHNYQRSKPFKLNSKCKSINKAKVNTNCVRNVANTYSQASGTTVVINGTGGMSLYNVSVNEPVMSYFAKVHAANLSPAYGAFVVSVYGDKLQLKFIDTNGAVQDSFQITKN
jgi:calcineurin-like phosphoesterase family protein